jgi:hypothetical protein
MLGEGDDEDAELAAVLDSMDAEALLATPPPAGPAGSGDELADGSAPPARPPRRARSPAQAARDNEQRRARRLRMTPEQRQAADSAGHAPRAQERARRASDEHEQAVHKALEEIHAASGASITANSMRLGTLPDGPDREVAKRDVAADIQRYAHVGLEDKLRCVVDFQAHANVTMRVCGACGLRDPSDACAHEHGIALVSSSVAVRLRL